ncbi:hypothetical protein ES702_04965 [subsurface metagenome]
MIYRDVHHAQESGYKVTLSSPEEQNFLDKIWNTGAKVVDATNIEFEPDGAIVRIGNFTYRIGTAPDGQRTKTVVSNAENPPIEKFPLQTKYLLIIAIIGVLYFLKKRHK